jgi:SAM-dependent methyltransferase
MDRNDWDARYSASELVWGAEPNRFLAEALADSVPCGRALDLACGEGRNAIWLAGRGWEVSAVDFSEVAIERARRLAAERGVEVDWAQGDVTCFEAPPGAFALAVVSYLQLPQEGRLRVFALAASALSPGSELFAVGHARRNLDEGVGGPKDPAVLWDPLEIRAELESLELSVERSDHVRRPVETEDGIRSAVDVLARARRPR